ncbi:hypothetical protein HPB52_020481 [Rhipicephalus sanguineus]|uniref:C2H2-type domain-containing protein n=1 Tax=Rhipicephalus sanguineus TaxID=34632 RepID=A0A9D4QEC7_RHISA|nr:hypothetical protein HPB52_020481 [Rhipicephalus sanguineus]
MARIPERLLGTPSSTSNDNGTSVPPQIITTPDLTEILPTHSEYGDTRKLVAVHGQTHPRGPRKGPNLKRCLVCGYTTPFSQRMEYHQRIHTGERPYKCQYCNKAFRQVAHLNEHVHIHTGERPFQCHLCPMKFVQKSKLKWHLKNHKT